MQMKLVLVRKRCGEVGPKKILMTKMDWPANTEADEILVILMARNLTVFYKVDQVVWTIPMDGEVEREKTLMLWWTLKALVNRKTVEQWRTMFVVQSKAEIAQKVLRRFLNNPHHSAVSVRIQSVSTVRTRLHL